MRMLKIARTSPTWRLLIIAMKSCVKPLIVPLQMMVLMVLSFGSLLFWVEENLEDEAPAFESIPHAMWFVIVTIATVGCGDVSPKSHLGKLAASFTIVAGVGYLAMPLAIVGGQFAKTWGDRAVLLALDKLKVRMGGKIDLDKLRSINNQFDTDNDSGRISQEELRMILLALDVVLSNHDVKVLFDAIDDDHSGAITIDEFEEFIASRS